MRHFGMVPVLVCALAAVLLGLAAASLAQTAPAGTGASSGQASHDGGHEMPEAYRLFRADLEKALAQSAPDRNLQKETFNFVVLYNCARPSSGSEVRERDLFYGLLFNYFAADGSQADQVSFIPYQLVVRKENASWRQTFSPQIAEDMYKLIPDRQEEQFGYTGGHNMDAALLDAIADARKQGVLNQTVFIALSEATFNEDPTEPAGYKRKTADAELRNANVTVAMANQQTWTAKTKDNKTVEDKIVYRIYLPKDLRPKGSLSGTRADAVTEMWRGHSRPEVPHADQTSGSNGGANNGGPPPPPPPPQPMDLTGLILGVCVALLVVATVLYIAWLQRPRSLTIRGADWEIPAAVVFGKALYLGVQDDPKRNVIGLPRLPDTVTAGEKLARLEVTPLGGVSLSSQSWSVARSPIQLTRRDSEVTLQGRTTDAFSENSIHLTLKVNS